MTFKEKIDKVLETNTLGINSISALEDKIEAGRGAINDFYKENREPGRITLKRIKSLPDLNWDWWETGKGEVFLTLVPKSTSNKQNGVSARETFYEELMEKNKDYFVAPRTIFTDYKIVPDKIIDVIIKSTDEAIRSLEKAKDLEIDSLVTKHEAIIQGLKNKIQRLEDENNNLRGQVP